MRASPITTLFSEHSPSNTFFSPYLLSVVLHIAGLTLFTLKMIQSHRIIERFPGGDRLTVRVLDFHSSEPQSRQASAGIAYPRLASYNTPSRSAAGTASPRGNSSTAPALTQQTARLMPAPHTLIQPDAPKNIVLPDKASIPLIVLWQPEKVIVKRPVLPPSQKPVISTVRPSLSEPIQEENLAELKITATPFVTATPSAPPSTTSPIVVHGPEADRKIPQTTSTPSDSQKPTPARILSLSDLRVKEGTVIVPLANQASPKTNPGMMIPGLLRDPSASGNGASTEKTTGAGASNDSTSRTGADPSLSSKSGNGQARTGNGTATGKDDKQGTGASSPKSISNTSSGQTATNAVPQDIAATHPSSQTGAANAFAQGAAPGSGAGNQPGSAHISLPHDGQFGVVVVGSSIAEQYPETAEMWSGRMASTVYLRVGQPKSWILQYALPRLIEAANPGSGRLEAPWPFEIVRPNLDPNDMDADAVILHGYVNQDGRFEKLELVFPPQLPHSAMLLNLLNQWQFRPAKLNGALTAIEVLLIIPDQSN